MVTLRIEHEITDLETWLTAFGRFAEVRTNAGVRAERLHRPVGKDTSIRLDLDFEDEQTARAFEHFLRTNVWSTPEASPALAGEVTTEMLEECLAPRA